MDTDNFEYYRNEIFKFIQKEIVPKYPEIESCTMHILPEYMAKDVEYIFGYKKNILRAISRKQKSVEILDREINHLLMDFCEDIGEEYYWLHILTIFKQ